AGAAGAARAAGGGAAGRAGRAAGGVLGGGAGRGGGGGAGPPPRSIFCFSGGRRGRGLLRLGRQPQLFGQGLPAVQVFRLGHGFGSRGDPATDSSFITDSSKAAGTPLRGCAGGPVRAVSSALRDWVNLASISRRAFGRVRPFASPRGPQAGPMGNWAGGAAAGRTDAAQGGRECPRTGGFATS